MESEQARGAEAEDLSGHLDEESARRSTGSWACVCARPRVLVTAVQLDSMAPKTSCASWAGWLGEIFISSAVRP